MTKKYYGYWEAGSSYNRDAYEDTNLRRLRKTMRDITQGNTYQGGRGHWWILEDPSQDDNTVAEGWTTYR